MSESMRDFGHAEIFDAEAIGQPGARRFRIFVRSPYGSASLWMERDQLETLMAAIEKVLAQASGVMTLRAEAQAAPTPPPGAPDDFPDDPDVEFQVGPMQLGYDEDEEELLLRATPLELIEEDGEMFARDADEPAFSVLFSRSQAQQLCSSVNSLALLGRPRCPFCGRPMQGRHFCDKLNGFHPANLN
jgi:uncharacterized repeat protein (TIGR03847 family)